MKGYRSTGHFPEKHSILVSDDSPASKVKHMIEPEKDDERSPEQRKKDSYSVIVMMIAVVIIGVSFVWHLWSALFPTPSP